MSRKTGCCEDTVPGRGKGTEHATFNRAEGRRLLPSATTFPFPHHSTHRGGVSSGGPW